MYNCAVPHAKNLPSLLGVPFRTLSLVLLLIGSVMSLFSIPKLSVTYDEPAHFRYGWQLCAQGKAQRFTDGTMPWSCWNALPRLLGLRGEDEAGNIQNGRVVTILFALLLGLTVRQWSCELYGDQAGFFASLLFVFCPNLLASAGLVTTDLYAACLLTLALYYLWQFTRRGGWLLALASMLALAFAQLTKYSLIMLYPIWALLLVSSVWDRRRHQEIHPALPGLANILAYSIGAVVVSMGVINAGFLFSGIGTPLAGYEFRSNDFNLIRETLGWMKDIALPLPYPYLEGLDWGQFYKESGLGYGNIYLLGTIHETVPGYHGFPGYYLIASLFKVPLASQAVLLLAVIIYAKRHKEHIFFQNEIFLLLPVAVYTFYLNFFYDRQIGLRHFILVFPLLHIFSSSLFARFTQFKPVQKLATGLLFLYLILSVLSYHPNYLAYFNELVPDRKYAYRILADSNLDWGQSQSTLDAYLEAHPEAYLDPPTQVEGLVVVSANKLVGVTDPEDFRWLRENCLPVGEVGYTHIIFDTRPESSSCQR